MDHRAEELRSALASCSEAVLDRWLYETKSRCWQLNASEEVLQELRERCGMFLLSLAESLHPGSKLELGAPEFREPIKVLSFTAGWMAGEGIPIGAGIALCQTLPVALNVTVGEPFESLAMVVAEAYATGQREQALASHRQVIRKSQVVAMLGEDLAGLILVGDPDMEAIEDAVGRLMMLVVMRRPSHLLVDVANAMRGEDAAREALEVLVAHGEALRGRRVMISGLPSHKAVQSPEGFDLPVEHFEEIERAQRRAAPGG